MADPLITTTQLEARIGPVETNRAEAFIDDASAKIRRFIEPTDPESVFPVVPDDVPDDLVPIVVRIVHRALENPLGLASETTGNYTWRRDAAAVNELVYLSDEDRSEIKETLGAPRGGFAAVTLVSPYNGESLT